MKKTFLVLLALSFCVMDGLFAQQTDKTREYVPLIPVEGEKQWDMRFDYYYGVSQYEIGKLGDEIEYEGQTYRELTIKYDDINYTVPFGLFREQDKKVYVRYYSTAVPHITDEELYYDFNLQVGDLFEVGYVDEHEYIQLMAIEEVVMEDGTVRNKFVFDRGWEFDDPEVWIEGVGSLAGINWRYRPGWTASGFSHLQCYFEDDDLVWTDGECWDDIDETTTETISVHPNPTKNVVSIEAENLQKVEVLNLLGQMVQSQESSAIDLSGLRTGVYYVRITDGEGRVEVRKVVKE